MCQEIYLKDKAISTIGDLKAMGWIIKPAHLSFDEDDNSLCLCGVNLEGILNDNDIIYRSDPFGYKVFQSHEHIKASNPNKQIVCKCDQQFDSWMRFYKHRGDAYVKELKGDYV